MNEYDKQAKDFLKVTGTIFEAQYLKHGKYFPGDTETRDIYRITLAREDDYYTFKFGQSIAASQKCIEPTAYDVLYCLTKYDPESFEDFCANYGYDDDSITALETYNAAVEEFNALSSLYTREELEFMAEIN